MFTFDAKFYKRNAVLDEHPWYLIPSKWMQRAYDDGYELFSASSDEDHTPRILHSCGHVSFNGGGNYGLFLPENLNHDYRCGDCHMRPSDKMLTLYTLLK